MSREIYDGFNELLGLAFLCLAHASLGQYGQAFTVLHEGMMKAKERDDKFIIGRLTNTLRWLHSEFGAVSQALEYDQESMELGRQYRIPNVEISALLNLGLDYFALGQHARALSYLESTRDRIEREAFGAHRWRWKVQLFIELAELSYAAGAYEQALRYVEVGLHEAHTTSSQKYVAKGWALRGKAMAQLGQRDVAGAEFRRALALAEQLPNPALISPLAYELGQWYEAVGQEQEAAALYTQAKVTIDHMATAVEDAALRTTFLQSALVHAVYEGATRLSVEHSRR